MTIKFALRLTVLVLCLSYAAFGAPIDLFNRNFTWIRGDVAQQGTYTDMMYATHAPNAPNPTQIIVGGNIDASTADWATGSGILDVFGYAFNGNACTGPWGNVCTTPYLEATMGLTEANLTGLLAAGQGVSNGSAIVWDNVTVNANDTIAVSYNFIANDEIGAGNFNDFAFFSAVNQTTPSTNVSKLSDVLTVGDFASTGWTTFNYTFLTSGTYRLGFGVVNVGNYNYAAGTMYNFDPLDPGYLDNIPPADFDSALALDLSPTPEPATWFMAGSALLLFGPLMRRLRKQ